MITIRPSKREDIGKLVEFQLRLADETENVRLNEETVSAGMHALFDEPSRGTYYVAVSHAEIVGCFLITYEWSDWRNGMVWWLQSVYVAKNHRRQGVFKIMYDHLRQIISSDPGIIGLRLYVDKTNTRAQNVYASMGMNGDHYTVFEWMKP